MGRQRSTFSALPITLIFKIYGLGIPTISGWVGGGTRRFFNLAIEVEFSEPCYAGALPRINVMCHLLNTSCRRVVLMVTGFSQTQLFGIWSLTFWMFASSVFIGSILCVSSFDPNFNFLETFHRRIRRSCNSKRLALVNERDLFNGCFFNCRKQLECKEYDWEMCVCPNQGDFAILMISFWAIACFLFLRILAPCGSR